LTELQEADNRDQQKDSTYDLLNNINLVSEIILPMQLRSVPTFYIQALSSKINPRFIIDAPHTLNLIAITDIDLTKFETRQ
jgi:hypothetical protein